MMTELGKALIARLGLVFYVSEQGSIFIYNWFSGGRGVDFGAETQLPIKFRLSLDENRNK